MPRNVEIFRILRLNNMGKYDNLAQHLKNCNMDVVTLSFTEIEDILGFGLPASAYTYNAWWSNGGHVQSKAWLDMEYTVNDLDLIGQEVSFIRNQEKLQKQNDRTYSYKTSANLKEYDGHTTNYKNTNTIIREKISLLGYEFRLIQQIIPECNADGSVKKYYPQQEFNNVKKLPLLKNGGGAFCRFRIVANDVPGVYLWIESGEVVYIGETANLRTRFNSGYGVIYPRNCFMGGQSTNCRMNKVAMSSYENGNPICLYFLETADYKRIEAELLYSMKTKYNKKDN